MSIYAWIWLTAQGVELLLSAHDHGKPRDGKHNFWHSLIAAIISTSLLYAGGFYNAVH